MSGTPVDRIRAQLDHPIIDSDGHDIEFLPMVRDELRELAGQDALDGFERMVKGSSLARGMEDDQRRSLGLTRIPWWGLPAENTRDRATAMLPRLFYERLDELGIDFAVVYPTYGLMAPSAEPAELRQALCRAFNRYHANVFAGLGDRLCPVASIPMHTPEEAVAELDYAVGELGMKATLVAGHVLRPLPGENVPRGARWLDTLGTESPHDYDPVWARCQELGVAPTFHSTGMGWGSRNSLHNYVFNHLGNFAAAGEAICRSLVLDGVPGRFPSLRFAFLEGGVAWACNLFSDLIGHWEKRNRDQIGLYDPSRIDQAQIAELFQKYGAPGTAAHLKALPDELHLLSEPDEDPAGRDEFAASGVERAEDLRDLFTERFFFGCEADDPQNAAAFDRRRNPTGAGLHAVFSSDVGHWDVPEMSGVLPEAFELVERELLSVADFRRFTYGSPMALWAGSNPDFFEGTVLEEAAHDELARKEHGA